MLKNDSVTEKASIEKYKKEFARISKENKIDVLDVLLEQDDINDMKRFMYE